MKTTFLVVTKSLQLHQCFIVYQDSKWDTFFLLFKDSWLSSMTCSKLGCLCLGMDRKKITLLQFGGQKLKNSFACQKKQYGQYTGGKKYLFFSWFRFHLKGTKINIIIFHKWQTPWNLQLLNETDASWVLQRKIMKFPSSHRGNYKFPKSVNENGNFYIGSTCRVLVFQPYLQGMSVLEFSAN